MIPVCSAFRSNDRFKLNRRLNLLLGLPFIILFWAQPLHAQQPSTEDLQKEIRALGQTVKDMQKDLQEIKALLLSRAAAGPPQNVVLDVSNSPAQGVATAKLTLVEFSDYQCPFCGRHVRETAGQIEKEYITTGKLRHVFVNLPLESIHRFAFKAAEAANCAGEQGRYWEMHNRLFENQTKLDSLTPHAQAIGLDVPKFEECLSSGRQATAIRRDMAAAQQAGVSGTPTFFFAYTDPKSSKIKTVRRLTGALPYATLKAEIDKLLAEEPVSPKARSDQK
jgi:protein-disulfide isomerase